MKMDFRNIFVFAILISGSGNVWTDGTSTWAGNPYCAERGLLRSESVVVDAGIITPDHCPVAGLNPSGCIEWFGAAPDLGACELLPLLPPIGVRVDR